MNEELETPRRPRWPLVAIPSAALVLMFLPLPLEPRAHAVAVIFAVAVIAWMTEIVPLAVTSLVIPALLSASGAVAVRDAFVGFGDPILFIFVGAFFMAMAMHRHGLDRRIAERILGARLLRGRPLLAFAAFVVVAVVLSMWVSNTATVAIMLPIFLGASAPSDDPSARPEAGVLTLAYASSVGGMGMLVGTPPNAIATRFLDDALEEGFGFVEWGMFGLPSAIVLSITLFVMFYFRGGRALRIVAPAESVQPPMSRGEKVTLACFLLAVAGWSIPGLAKAAGLPYAADWAERLHPGGVALLASLPLFVVRDRPSKEGASEAVLPWREGSRIDWGIIMLFAGGISLGSAMVETGLADAIGEALVASGGIRGLWSLTLISIVFSIFFTEICSNTAAANMLVPLVIAAAAALGVNPIPPAVGVGLAASCAFMLPIATGPNAIAYGSGVVTAREMMRFGFVLNIVCGFVLTGLLFLLTKAYGID